MIDSSDKQINDAVHKVRELITEVVRLEQWRDQLTGLPNDVALNSVLEQLVNDNKRFWFAFIEIDKFKSINDRYSYAQADNLLKRVADNLSHQSSMYFGGQAKTFRAHGDEFYVIRELPAEPNTDELHAQLDTLRASIAQIRIPVDGVTEPMRCTVSVGWLLSTDAQRERKTAQGFKVLLEQTIAVAKRDGRDRVVRYDAERVLEGACVTLRADCGTCGAKFSVDVAPDRNQADAPLRCPNCGAELPRPLAPGALAESRPPLIEA